MNLKVIIALALTAAFVAAGAFSYLTGRGHGYSEAAAHYQAVMAEQAAANQRAVDSANRDLLRAADALDAKSQELDDALNSIDQAAGADPDSGNMCLPADSVMRLNKVTNR